MGSELNQRNNTRNQSTADYSRKNLFTFGNRYQESILRNNTGAPLDFESGLLVVRNLGTKETASFAFVSALTAGQTVVIAGLTYTSTGATTAAQLANAFANLEDGATSGNGVATGTYSGALTDYSTGGVFSGSVTFTATTVGDKTNLAATGTGILPVATVVNGTIAFPEQVIPATADNLADVIGILFYEGVTEVPNEGVEDVNYAICGDVDAGLLLLPAGVTINTVVGNKTLKDILTDLGFVLNNVTENSNFDN